MHTAGGSTRCHDDNRRRRFGEQAREEQRRKTAKVGEEPQRRKKNRVTYDFPMMSRGGSVYVAGEGCCGPLGEVAEGARQVADAGRRGR